MVINNLFPTAVASFDLPRGFYIEELSFIKNQKVRPNEGNTTSVDTNILNNKELTELQSFVQNSIDKYFNEVYAPKQETHLRITQSWCNYTGEGGFHHKHSHPNSFVSGVLYVQAIKDEDKIYFFKEQYQQLKTPTESWNEYNSNSWWLEAFSGRMYIFPSSMVHMVQAVTTPSTRISLSFNTFPVGFWGDDHELTGLKL